MQDLGYAYSLTVLFPSSAALQQLKFRFYQNLIETETITDSCGIDNGMGSYDRTITLRGKDMYYITNWNECNTSSIVGFVCNNTDCNDSDMNVHTTQNFYVDADHDGYGTGDLVSACAANAVTAPYGYSLNNTDCDDTDALIYRSATLYTDADGDTYTVGAGSNVCYGATLAVGTTLTQSSSASV